MDTSNDHNEYCIPADSAAISPTSQTLTDINELEKSSSFFDPPIEIYRFLSTENAQFGWETKISDLNNNRATQSLDASMKQRLSNDTSAEVKVSTNNSITKDINLNRLSTLEEAGMVEENQSFVE